jgi:hypothetical protein
MTTFSIAFYQSSLSTIKKSYGLSIIRLTKNPIIDRQNQNFFSISKSATNFVVSLNSKFVGYYYVSLTGEIKHFR